MELHRVDADVKLLRHLGIPQAPRRELNHLVLPRRERTCIRIDHARNVRAYSVFDYAPIARRYSELDSPGGQVPPRRSGCTAMARRHLAAPSLVRRSLSWTKLAVFAARFRAERVLGYRVAWTAHQVLPHETSSAWLGRAGTRIVARASHSIIVHDEAPAASLQAMAPPRMVTPSRPAGRPAVKMRNRTPRRRLRHARGRGVCAPVDATVDT